MKALNRTLVMLGAALFLGLPVAEALACTSVETRGTTSTIRFDFDKDYVCGQYANGDWWVVASGGQVRIVSMTPAYSNGRNGWEINPDTPRAQGFDNRIHFWDESLVPSLPANVPPGSSVVKTASRGETNPSLQFAAVLTVVASPPAQPAETFRPPYFGAAKPVYTTADVNWGRLPSLSCTSCVNKISLATARERMRHVQLDHLWDWHGREMHPAENISDEYGADLSKDWSENLLRVMLDDPLADKRQAVIYLIQAGIDLAPVIPGGGGWPAGGGHMLGRKQMLLFAGVMLNDAGILETVANPGQVGFEPTFQEDGQIFRGQNGVALWGNANPPNEATSFWRRFVTNSGHGSARDSHGWIDGGDTGAGGGYQWVTTLPFKYSALIVHLMNARAEWDQEDFIEYVDRWVNYGYHTWPDPCAPYDGSGWTGGGYGVTFGPIGGDETADCIKGSGRIPEAHHTAADGGGRRTKFGDEMWAEFRSCSETCSCAGQVCSGNPPPVVPPPPPPAQKPLPPIMLTPIAEPPVDPPPVDPPPVAGTCTDMQSGSISFVLDGQYTCGQYVTGDWWVMPATNGGRVGITEMQPSAYSSGCSKTGHHGWEINPDSDARNALDDRSQNATFDGSLMPCLPYQASPGESILKVRSYDPSANDCEQNSADSTCLDDVAILTIVAEAPPANAFRPPFVDTEKAVYTTDELDLSRLPSLPTVANTPSIEDVRTVFGGPWIDHVSGWRSRYFHPSNTMRNRSDGSRADYGAELSRSITEAMLRTMHQESDAEKMELVIPIVQFGIDLYHQMLAGQWWSANGGHQNGRKLPILYAGKLLDHPGMLGIGFSHAERPGTSCSKMFSEDGQTYYGENGVALWGEARDDVCGCGGKYGGNPDYDVWFQGGCRKPTGHAYCRDPNGLVDGGHRQRGDSGNVCTPLRSPQWQIDNDTWEASGYQWCCTSGPWIGTQIAALLLDLKDDWNHGAFFDYVDRYMGPPWNGQAGYDSTYFNRMYETYRACAPDCE